MSVQDAIGATGIKTGDYTATRTAASTTDGYGRAVAGATTTVAVAGSVQPYNGALLKVLPEGIYAEDVRHIFTITPMLVRPRPDTIVIDGVTFAVFAVEGPWNAFGGVHYVVHVARVLT